MTWEDFERMVCWMVLTASGCYCNLFDCEHSESRRAVHEDYARRWPR